MGDRSPAAPRTDSREAADRCRQPASVHQVGAALGRDPRGGNRGARRAHGPALGSLALGGVLRGARASGAGRGPRPSHVRRPDDRVGARDAIARREARAVLVYGDTNSTLAGARGGGGLPVAHVEAGLRSGDLDDAGGAKPDRGRRARGAAVRARRALAARFCATRASTGEIHVVGDVMADAVARFGPLARERSHILGELGARARRRTSSRPSTARPTCVPTGCGGSSPVWDAVPLPVVLPAHPRTRSVLAEHGDRPAAVDHDDRAARLPRFRGARVASAR